jgi:hybrid cluster-associated redox disulfide protein
MLSPQTLLADLLDHSPQMAGQLLELRLDCVGCSMNKFCTLEELCNAYELDLESVLSKIQERLTNAKNHQET